MSGDARPLVSVGMSVRNNERTLSRALRSILRQSYTNWELILIDDGSTDGTLRVARSLDDPRIRLLSDGNSRGLSDRLNQAIELSTGRYFARMDGDDVAYPERFTRQVAFLERHPEVDLVGAGAIIFRGAGAVLGQRRPAQDHLAICRRPFAGFPMIHPTFMGRIEFFKNFGYRAAALWCEDQDLLARASGTRGARIVDLSKSQDQDLLFRSYRDARFANLPEILLGYREERLDLRKILRSRTCLACSLASEFRRRGRYDLAFLAIAGQVFKGAVDSIAVGTQLDYKLLRHRARPVSSDEVLRWRDVWASVGDAVGSAAEPQMAARGGYLR